jgi:hypothetical protein
MQQNIVFNGKSYRSLEEMPPEVREAYESVMQIMADQNQNGVPDLFEGRLGAKVQKVDIVFNGQAYEKLSELPPEAREKYQQMMGKYDKDGNGIPDFAERIAAFGTPSTPAPTVGAVPSEPVFPQSSAIPVSPSAIEPEQNSPRFVLLAVALVFLLCMGAVIFYILYTQR